MLFAPNPLTRFAIRQARAAGAGLRASFGRVRRIHYKSPISLVTDADRRSEALITRAIRRAYPTHALLAEESARLGTKGRGSGATFRWIVDPLDGTTNYAHRYPVFCVSIALEHQGRIILGVIYQPILDELFVAERSRGAWLNGHRIRVSATARLRRSLLSTGFSYDIHTHPGRAFTYFTDLTRQAQGIRRAGAAAIDLAYVALGRFDGFWEEKLAPWDVAAGWLLVEEAGGRVTSFAGGPYALGTEAMLASNGRIHGQMLQVLSPFHPPMTHERPPRSRGGRVSPSC